MTGQRTVHTQHGPISAETADAIEQDYGQGALVLAIEVRSHNGALRTMLKGTSDTGTQFQCLMQAQVALGEHAAMLAKDLGSYIDDRVKSETAVELIKVLAGLRMEDRKRAQSEAGAEKPANAEQADDKPKEDS